MSTQDPTLSSRVQAYRRRHRAAGYKSCTLWLSPTTQARIAKLKGEEESLSSLFDRALEALAGITRKEHLLIEAEELRRQGFSWYKIAQRWNAEGIPTCSGRGKWYGFNILAMKKLHCAKIDSSRPDNTGG
jgi:hypothetical protein